MSGQMRKYNYKAYNLYVKNMPEPVSIKNIPPVKLDLKGIRAYAKARGISIARLTDEEKSRFMAPGE